MITDPWFPPYKNFVRLLAKLGAYRPTINDAQEIFYDRGAWWFWNEIWVDKHGPYASIEEAKEELIKYAETI